MAHKSRILHIALLLLVLCLISTVMLSGTFAKYTSEYSGQDTALVARWQFVAVAGQDIDTTMEGSGSQRLALFNHEYNTHIKQKNGTGIDEEYIIAPGINGHFLLSMGSTSDVDADVEITIKGLDDNVSVPIEYLVCPFVNNDFIIGENWVTLDDLAREVADTIIGLNYDFVSGNNLEEGYIGKFRMAAVDVNNGLNMVLLGVKWRWPYEASSEVYEGSTNATDTALGIASAATNRTSYGIEITVTATQVAPGIEAPEEP